MDNKFKKLDTKIVKSLGIKRKPKDIVIENWIERLGINTETNKEKPTKQEK